MRGRPAQAHHEPCVIFQTKGCHQTPLPRTPAPRQTPQLPAFNGANNLNAWNSAVDDARH